MGQPACGDRLPTIKRFIEVLLLAQSFFIHFLLAQRACYFLCLDTKKVTKEKSRLQIILGLLFFSLPTQYNSSAYGLLKQYCLLKAFAASFKTVALSQNSLRPIKIQLTSFI